MAYEILSNEEYMNKVKEILDWSKTSIHSLEEDDTAITSQIAEVSVFLGRVVRDEAETAIALDILESQKRTSIREEKVSNGEKVTEKFLDDSITRDLAVQDLRKLYAETKSRTIVVQNLMQAISNSKRQFIERNKERINHEIKRSIA